MAKKRGLRRLKGFQKKDPPPVSDPSVSLHIVSDINIKNENGSTTQTIHFSAPTLISIVSAVPGEKSNG